MTTTATAPMVMVKCGKCGGRGKRPLPAKLVVTLRALERAGEATPSALARAVGKVRETSMANRLVTLLRHGLVTRRVNKDNAREVLYRARRR